MFSSIRTIVLTVTALTGAVAACDPTLEPASGITLHVLASSGDAPASNGGAVQAVVIDRVTLVLGGIKLETAGVDGTVDFTDEESRVIELDLSGEPVMARSLFDVPAGTYKEIEVSIDKLEPGNASEDLLIVQYPELADASLAIADRVVGHDGTEATFTFSAALDRDMEIHLTPFLDVAGDGESPEVHLMIVLHAGGWFRTSAGEWSDPRDPANRSLIESNIQASFEAFEDGDVDGQPGPVIR